MSDEKKVTGLLCRKFNGKGCEILDFRFEKRPSLNDEPDVCPLCRKKSLAIFEDKWICDYCGVINPF